MADTIRLRVVFAKFKRLRSQLAKPVRELRLRDRRHIKASSSADDTKASNNNNKNETFARGKCSDKSQNFESQMNTGRYLTSLRQDRKKVKELTLTEAANLSRHRGGAQQLLYEYLDDDHHYVPFTDSDIYCDNKDPPSQEFIHEVLDGVFRNLYKLVGSQSPENADFKMATRHGLVEEKGVYKLSFRCYLFGFKIKLKDMRDLIVSKGLNQNGLGSFDKAPYNKTQLLGCVGFAKSETDGRLLLPTVEDCSEPGILESFMVQNLTGEEPILVNDDESAEEQDAVPEAVEDDVVETDGPRFCPPWDLLEKCIMSLSVERRCEKGTYHEWTRIGWAIAGCARIAKRSSDGLDLWLRFCKQSSVYYEDSCTAISVFSRASNHGRRLGWKSLMEALKEDAPDVHTDIESELCPTLKDQNILKVIKQFVKINFRRPIATIDKVILRNYRDTGKFLIVTLNHKASCDFVDEDHEDGSRNYIVIGLKNARDKCPHNSCVGKQNIIIDSTQYPGDVKTIVEQVLRTVHTPEDAIRKFVLERKDTAFKDMDDNMAELGPLQKLPFCNRYQLTKNIFCPICRCKHNKPENCLLLDQAAKMMTLGCRLDPDNFHPPGGLALPSSVTNVFIQNVNIQANGDQLNDDVFNEEFPIFEDRMLNRLVNVSLKGFASDIARVFVYLGRDQFGVQSGDRDTWWAWDKMEKRWMQSSHKANLFCDEIVSSKYVAVGQWLRQNTPDDDNRNRRLQKIDNLLKRLKDRDQHSILCQAAILLKEEKRAFETSLDANKNLLNFRGQVFDFETVTLREVVSTDNVSRTTGYELPEPDVDYQTFIMDFMKSIMPDSEHVDYLMTWLASCLDGWNREETFSILSGSGRNGKSLLRDLLASAFGEAPSTGYFGVVAASLLTKERPSSDRPVADLLHMKGKRLLIASEPEKGARVNCGFLKFLTGNDPINGRWLQSNAEISFQPQHSLALLCNSIPNLDANDEAVWDRTRVLKFPFKFVSRPTQDHHRKSDPFLKSKLPRMGPQLMLMLLEYYKRYKSQGLEPTPEMTMNTEAVRSDNDVYGDFITETVEHSQAVNDQVVYNDLLERCKTWMSSHPVYKTLGVDSSEARKAMERFCGGAEYKSRRPPEDKKRDPRRCWNFVRWRKPVSETPFVDED